MEEEIMTAEELHLLELTERMLPQNGGCGAQNVHPNVQTRNQGSKSTDCMEATWKRQRVDSCSEGQTCDIAQHRARPLGEKISAHQAVSAANAITAPRNEHRCQPSRPQHDNGVQGQIPRPCQPQTFQPAQQNPGQVQQGRQSSVTQHKQRHPPQQEQAHNGGCHFGTAGDHRHSAQGGETRVAHSARAALAQPPAPETVTVAREVTQRSEIGGAPAGGQGGLLGVNHPLPDLKAFHEYQRLVSQLLDSSDYQVIGGKRMVKRSGWRKLALAFSVSFESRSERLEWDEHGNVSFAHFVQRAIMPDGRFADGWGACDAREKRYTKPNHDVPATAETRAKNRACSDLFGIGESKR